MGATSKLYFLLTALLATTMPLMASSARPLSNQGGSRSNLATRLKLDEESSNCWDSLTQLQACSSDLLLFFIGGPYLGHGCGVAIRTIEHQCWPSLLGSLGFSAEETDILITFCDEPNQNGTSPPAFNEATGEAYYLKISTHQEMLHRVNCNCTRI